MSRAKASNHKHALERGHARLNLPRKQVERLIKEAQTAGKTYDHLPLGPIRSFIKSRGQHKRVKLYQDIVFVFSKTSTACITLYKLDEELIKKQKEYEEKRTEVLNNENN